MNIGAGIDVSKQSLDVALFGHPGIRSFRNNAAGLRQLIQWLSPWRPERIVLEATGGFELAALDALYEAGLPAVRVNPRQARDFAKALGQLAKTDRLDAHVLAAMACKLDSLHLYQPATAEQRQLRQWHQRRAQVVDMLLKEKQHRDLYSDATLRKQISQMIQRLQRERLALDKHIEVMVHAQPPLQVLKTIKGVGPVTVATLACHLPELGDLSNKAIAKLTGVAPMARESGQWRGKRSIWGGRGQVRQALYMAVLTAIRYEPRLRDFYQSLRARGKPGKVALVATMRKLLVILNARMKEAKAQTMAT